LIVMFVLGGLQGVLGWYMVKSGLVDRVDVSQYRLAAHLCAALLIFSYIFWVALDLRPAGPARVQGDGVLAASSAGLVGLLFLQIALGAFVAGLDAGQGYNTWPLMDGALIPSGLGAMSPWYLNLFENALTVQFNHRMLAYLVALWAVIHAVASYRRAGEGPVSLTASVIVLAIVVQIALGVATLLSHVALDLALMHQGGAVVLLALALYQLHQFVGQPQAGGIA
ncbi:MAG: heme A synthase, partial [Alphaproteobacteria bacterium]